MRLLFTSVIFVYALAACGLKGPLYLPPADDTNQKSAQQSEKK
ncbi:MAG: lipoprotein [Nitrosomonas sp.]|nr:lipoprotein [Nitrosomonas sp.]HRB28774.1 lipoprotein [Nitrosomonas sp.]